MSVRLIGITKPVVGEMDLPSEMLAYCARVSNEANQNNHATGDNLIRRLMRHKEWSPLEMVSLTMEITTTRDISRQILRHRSFSFQEFSQRYSAVYGDVQLREARDQHPTNRQSSLPVESRSAQDDWRRAQERVWETAVKAYTAALSRGMAKEVARVLLPEGLTQTKLYMAGTLRSWAHYCALRCGEETQLEHRLIAEACLIIVLDQFPQLEGFI